MRYCILACLLLVACSSSSGGASGDGGTGFGSSSSSSSSSSGGGGGGGTVGALCSSSSPCASGLTCAQSGSLLGRCTADCSANLDLCTQKFGSNTVCMNASQCALLCTSSSQCPGSGECVPLTGGVSACITNPNGGPDSGTLPNGECANVGGAFGDTVMNGGYRCTPNANGMVGTSVDQCNNGTWSTAYMCTCSVMGTPSECFDITSAGTAQCSYGVTVCAQCVPGSGCQ